MQDGSTASMIFGVAELISYCSRFFTPAPGDIILTGTPAGCGDFRTPAIALRPGDLVEIEVDNLDRQHSQVVAPSLAPAPQLAEQLSAGVCPVGPGSVVT